MIVQCEDIHKQQGQGGEGNSEALVFSPSGY